MGFSRVVASFELIPIVTSWNYNTTQSFVNRQVFTELTVPGCDRCPSRPTGYEWLETPRPRPNRVTDAGVFAQSANTQIYTRFKLRICWSTKVVVLRQPKSYGSKSLSGITHSNHKQKRAILSSTNMAPATFCWPWFEVKGWIIDFHWINVKIVPDWPIAELFT